MWIIRKKGICDLFTYLKSYHLGQEMSTQSHEQTEEELSTAITLLIAVGASTESELFTEWHQSLQKGIQQLMTTVNLIQKQTAIDKASGLSAVVPLRASSKGGAF